MDNQNLLISELIIENNPPQEEVQHRRGVHNVGVLGYRELIYQSEGQLLVADLGSCQKSHALSSFKAIKQVYEKGIKKFKHANSQDVKLNSFGGNRKRIYSTDMMPSGAYYLNNWISNDDYPCEKPSPEQKTAHLIYELLASQWSKALDIVDGLEKTLEVKTLAFILKGFKSIENIINEANPTVKSQFLERDRHQINFKSSSESVGGAGSFVNTYEEDAKTRFSEMRSLPKKIDCLKVNLEFLINFASRYEVRSNDDYIMLAFKLLGNSVDQEQNVLQADKDFRKLLARLNLKIYDRLNFATKLLPEKKRKLFNLQLQQVLSTFPCLDNILFYLNSPLRIREEKIQQICKAYLDEYGDLETIAYLSLEFPFLKQYYYQFKQALEFAYQLKEIERIENYRWGENSEDLKEAIDCRRNKKMVSFFELVNIPEERINEPKISKDSCNICEICSKKIQKSQNFLECGKCRHGGHPNHLLKWFEQSENCPHIGCPCVCN